MQYLDIAEAINNYRKKQEIFHDSSIADKHYFVNPTEGTPVETSRFLKHLDLEWVDPILKGLFLRFDWIKHRLYPRVRLMIFMKLRKDLQMVAETVMALHSNLIDYGEATIKSDVDAWRKKQWSHGSTDEPRKIMRSYTELFEFIIQTLNRYGMLFDSQPQGYSNVEMKSM